MRKYWYFLLASVFTIGAIISITEKQFGLCSVQWAIAGMYAKEAFE